MPASAKNRSTKARTTRSAHCTCSQRREGIDAQYKAKLVRWAELLAMCNRLKSMTVKATRDGILDAVDADNVMGAVDCLATELLNGVPCE